MNREGKRCVLFRTVIVPILLLAAAAASGGVNRWTASGPDGGSITALAVSPASPQVLYAGASEGGVFKSKDGAATWSPTARFPEGGQTRALVIDPTTPATVYAGTETGVLKTMDGGASWKALSFPAKSVSTLAIDPKKPSTLYAAVFGSAAPVFKSEDAGGTWFAASDGLPSHSAPTLAMDPSNPSSLFLATGGGGSGVFATTDGGAHWKTYSSFMSDVFVVAIDPSPPGILYAGTSNGLLKSVNGAAWQKAGLSVEPGFNRVYSIAVSPFFPGRLYVATQNGTYKSEDRAETWSPINEGFPFTLPQTNNRYTGPPSIPPLNLVFDPSDPSMIYAGTGGGVFKSTSGGERWARSTFGIHGAIVESIAVSAAPGSGAGGPFAAEAIYAGMGANGLARSGDGGRSWKNLDLDAAPIGITSVVSLPSDSRTVLAGAWDGGIYRSLDAGASWAKVSQTLDQVLSLAADRSGSRVFSGGVGQITRSEDGGKTWEVALSQDSDFDYPPSFQALGVAPSNPQVVYTAANELFRSLDGGKTWNSTGPLPEYEVPAGFRSPAYANVLAIDPLSASTLYIATCCVGLIKSDDGGKTFRQLRNGLPDSTSSVVIDPTDSSTLYAAAGLVFRSLDGGETWAPFGKGLEGQIITSLAIDRSGRRLFAGAYGGGLFHYEIVAGPFDLSIGPDGGATLLVNTGAGAALFTSLDRLGSVSRSGPYGPYDGWTAQATAAGADGLTRLLWNNEDGSAALWLLSAGRNQASYPLVPMPGWTAIDVAAGVAGSTDILRIRGDGAMAIFRVDNSGQVAAGPTYGPYTGWSATAIASGPDGLTRVLWNNVDGSAGISLMQSGILLATSRHGPAAGWTAVDLAVGADGQARLIWTHADGRMALWRVDKAGNPTAYGPIYEPPAGFTATRVSAGADGLTRVLWSGAEGSSKIWLMSADNIFLQSFDIGPN